MVARQDRLEQAAHAIENALWDLVLNRASDKVYVFDTEWGHLWALIGSDAFKGKGIGERQDLVWKHLRDHPNVCQQDLGYLTRVNPMDHEEYKASVAGDLQGA